jgi:hypothetical protein
MWAWCRTEGAHPDQDFIRAAGTELPASAPGREADLRTAFIDAGSPGGGPAGNPALLAFRRPGEAGL